MTGRRPARLDEHTALIAASVDDVWPSLLEAVDRAFSRPGAGPYARLVGCADPTSSGPRPLGEGSTIPGFRVSLALPGRELLLEGRHRFSSYALRFVLEPLGPASSRLRAESLADFPGLSGRLYRGLILGTGAHVLAVRRLLAAVRRRSERQTAREALGG
jgi:hypothetical protein